MFDPKTLLTEVELNAYRETGDLMASIKSEATRQALCERLGIEVLPSITNLSDERRKELRELVGPNLGQNLGMVLLEYERDPEDDSICMLKVATDRPLDSMPISMLTKEYPEAEVQVAYASKESITEGLRELYGVAGAMASTMLESGEWNNKDFSYEEEAIVIDPNDEEATSINFVNKIFADAVRQRATDIHFEPKPNELQVRYRVDGKLRNANVLPEISRIKTAIIARLKIMAGMDTAERRMPQDGRIAIELEHLKMDTRVVTIPSIEGEAVVVRILGQRKFDMNALDLDAGIRAKIEETVGCPNGIILVTGPTGCGKSTSLYSFLSSINNPDTKITTIEEPVENKLEGAVQIPVEANRGLTFAAILRHVLRSDPNVIMVGEMRDPETAEIAVQAALTGHLVFSTLHTNDSISGVTRMLDLGIDAYLVAGVVRAILAQRLVRRLCTHCRQPGHFKEEDLDRIKFPTEGRDQIYIASENGCRECDHTGYFDRIGVYEIFMVDPEIEQMIQDGAPKLDLKNKAIALGFETMRQYGWKKVIEGITTIEEVMKETEA